MKKVSTYRPMFRPAFAAGTAMIETTLALPFFAVILSLTFFFGWVMMHKQQTILASRYNAWSRVDTGVWPDEARINDIVFANKAAILTLGQATGDPAVDNSWGGGGSTNTTPGDLISSVGNVNQIAGGLADEMVGKRFPHGYRASVAAEFSPVQNFWAQFRGPISAHDSREGVSWRRDNVTPWNVLRDQFYSPFDTALESVAPPANDMAQMIRSLYLAYW